MKAAGVGGWQAEKGARIQEALVRTGSAGKGAGDEAAGEKEMHEPDWYL